MSDTTTDFIARTATDGGAANVANPFAALQGLGQSVWLDYLRRSLFTSGEFSRLMTEDGLRGVTSNPSIFERAVVGSTDYLEAFRAIEQGQDLSPMALYEALAIRDIREAADLLRQIYDFTGGADGYVSLEVCPYLAHDTGATIADARRLWKAVDRDNLLIKVPGTAEGVPAIRQLISEGVNVNITLLFSVGRYAEVAHAYMDGLATFVENGGHAAKVASVASFFISRVDTMVDGLITKRLATVTGASARTSLTSLLGTVAIANAKLAYQRYLELLRTPAWQRLAARGAHPQRLLWASTSTKNPRYRDVRYVEELIGRDTVNTIPPATLDAFRDHGRSRASLEEHVEKAHETIDALKREGISLDDVTARLVDDGVALFSEAFDTLLTAVGKARRSQLGSMLDRQRYVAPHDLSVKVRDLLADWQTSGQARRLWARDATRWAGSDEGRWLGWPGIAGNQLTRVGRLQEFAQDIASAGFSHAVLLGVGGSSLCPAVMQQTFGSLKGFPELHVLDSTDPAQIAETEGAVDIARTLFIVSSQSGTSLEPDVLLDYFLARVGRAIGKDHVGKHFIAITDPDSTLRQVATRERFRCVFLNVPGIGGRYSALSTVGLIPAALTGVDVGHLLHRAELMVHSCAADVPAGDNPAIVLGAVLGTLARAGRDKVTVFTSPGISALSAWIGQLIAESTGKQGAGLIPVDREPIGPPGVYSQDRVFVYLRLDPDPATALDAAVNALERAGHPVVRIAIADMYDIGQEFVRWEMATTMAGAIMGINPSAQPDVEMSKVAARELISSYEQTGMFPTEIPMCKESGLTLFTDANNAAALEQGLDGGRSLAGYLRAHLNRIQRGDYFALLAYLAMSAPHENALQVMRRAVRDRTRAATCLVFGPRFVHSTGQANNGGPNTGVFLQLTCDDVRDIPVPGHKYSFGAVKAAQARGDFAVLVERGRRALRVHLGMDVKAGLNAFQKALTSALQDHKRNR